jgi:WD40 repeat protein
VTASGDRTVKVWDAEVPRVVAELTGFRDLVEVARFSPDGTAVATAGWDGTAALWELPRDRRGAAAIARAARCHVALDLAGGALMPAPTSCD